VRSQNSLEVGNPLPPFGDAGSTRLAAIQMFTDAGVSEPAHGVAFNGFVVDSATATSAKVVHGNPLSSRSREKSHTYSCGDFRGRLN
jgi:hypothetical protein